MENEQRETLINVRRSLIKALQDVEEELNLDETKRLTRRRRDIENDNRKRNYTKLRS